MNAEEIRALKREGLFEVVLDAIRMAVDEEREGAAVVAELWTEGKSSYRTASEAIRARRPIR